MKAEDAVTTYAAGLTAGATFVAGAYLASRILSG